MNTPQSAAVNQLARLDEARHEAFGKLDIIQFEDADPEAEDRRLGLA